MQLEDCCLLYSKKLIKCGLVILISLFSWGFVQSQTISGVINSYARVTSITTTTLTFDNVSLAPNLSQNDAFGVGKKILIIQMKGATIQTANTSSFGTLINLNNAGNFEVLQVLNLAGNTITLSGFQKTYTVSQSVQIVSFPEYNNVAVIGTLTAIPWSRTLGRGGIVTFEVLNNLTLGANIDVSGQGFVGGSRNITNGAECSNNVTYVSEATDNTFSPAQYHAQKGESMVDYTLNGISNLEYGRCPLLGGGGGGNSHNGGGGGGGNFTAGGNSGIGWTGASACTGNNISAGLGGYALPYSVADNKIFLGSGGGGGQQNNDNATNGGNGGGIIFIRAKRLYSNCVATYGFLANGTSAANTNGNDGAGGGGAGGVIFLEIYNYILSCNISIHSNGGNGGNVATGNPHGGGGGGGVGAILLLKSPPNQMVINSNPGSPGKDCNSNNSACNNPSGNAGAISANPVQIGWAGIGIVAPLPVMLSAFEAKLKNNKIELIWQTSTEYNTQKFEIEKTNNFNNYKVIGEVEALGTSNVSQGYSFLDQEILIGDNYYRLRIIDFDGTVNYSKWVVVKAFTDNQIKIFPNPVSQQLFVEDKSSVIQPKKLFLYNAYGNIVYQRDFDNELVIDIRRLAKGFYTLKIFTSTQTMTQKIVVN